MGNNNPRELGKKCESVDTAVDFIMVDLNGTRDNAYLGESITLPARVNGYHNLVLKTVGKPLGE